MANLNLERMESLFKDNIDMLMEEIQDNDKLYAELKEHFDSVKNSYSSGALTFISKQTPNLVSLKSNKLSAINSLFTIKKAIVELSLKTEDDGETDTSTKNLIKGIHELLVHNKAEEYIAGMLEGENKKEHQKVEPDGTIPVDEDMDKLEEELNKRMEEIEEQERLEAEESGKLKQQELVVGKDYYIVADSDGNMYPVDEDYNMLEDIIMPTWYLSFETDEDDGTLHAYNHYGEEVEIVEFTEDDDDEDEEEYYDEEYEDDDELEYYKDDDDEEEYYDED